MRVEGTTLTGDVEVLRVEDADGNLVAVEEAGGKAKVTLPASGGSQPGAARWLKFPFDFSQAVALAVGVPVFDFAAGDVLLNAYIVTPSSDPWITSEVLSLADIGVIDSGAWVDSGFFNRSTGPVDVASATWDVQGPFLKYSHSFGSTPPPSLLGVAIASGGGTYSEPTTPFISPATLSLVVSGNGTPSGEVADAESGTSTLYIVVSTPGDAS